MATAAAVHSAVGSGCPVRSVLLHCYTCIPLTTNDCSPPPPVMTLSLSFSFMLSLLAMSLRDGFCVKRQGGTGGGGGWVNLKDEKKKNMAVSGLGSEKGLVVNSPLSE